MHPRGRRGIIAISTILLIVGASSLLLVTQSSKLTTWYASVTPPMSKCGLLPHSEPSYLTSQFSQIKNDPKFIHLESGTSFQYSANSQMVEKYYNGTSTSVLQISFVHLISNSKEDIIYAQVFQNGIETFSLQSYDVVCFEPGGSMRPS